MKKTVTEEKHQSVLRIRTEIIFFVIFAKHQNALVNIDNPQSILGILIKIKIFFNKIHEIKYFMLKVHR